MKIKKEYLLISALFFSLATGVAYAKEKKDEPRTYIKTYSGTALPLGETSNGFTEITVQCDKGDTATGGGYKKDSIYPEGQQQAMTVTDNYPVTNQQGKPNGWAIVVHNQDGAADNYRVDVVCQVKDN